jgi:multidrug efflux pump subunit AcrA (membrane-fusion protein)
MDLPMLYRGETPEGGGAPVRLHARFAGGEHTWTGRIVRTEGEIDARSRMVNVVARVEDPYGRSGISDAGDGSPPGSANDERPPLAVGLFVEAEIQGRRVENAVTLPRSALRGGDRVLVVDAENRMHFRDVVLLRSQREDVVIGGGLAAGEDVVVSPLSAVVDGMAVRVARDGPDETDVARDGGATAVRP